MNTSARVVAVERRTSMISGKAITQAHDMKEAVKRLTHYMTTYDGQFGYEDYMTQTYVDDVLYGLGISLSEHYETATGFAEFKADLLEYLKEDAARTAPVVLAPYEHYRRQLGGTANE